MSSVGSLAPVIGAQVRQHRLAAGWSIAQMADRVGVSKPMLSKIENAQTSCSLTTLERLATGLGIPVTALFRGAESDADREAVLTTAGNGALIVRRGSNVGHVYRLLGGLRGEHRRMEAHEVSLSEVSEVFPLFQHAGTELIYMLEGVMVYGHGTSRYRLAAGDALQFDGEGAHGPAELVQIPIRFLSIIAHGGPHDPMDQ